MAAPDLRPFFDPRGVAVVGARRSMGFGYGIPLMLKRSGWDDRLRLVNPSGGTLHDLPVYESVADVPDPVELAVLLVPAGVVPEALDQAGSRGIRHAIIESAGFAEVGGQGKELQDRAAAVARRHGMRVIGPNCVGLVNTANGFSTVEVTEESLAPGRTGIIAQSGVFGNCLLDVLPGYRLFVSKAVTLGDRMDIDECDMLEYLAEDQDTDVIMMYLEGAADGARLRRVLSEVTRRKPVAVLKSGRTPAGRAATVSHTGSLSGEDDLYEGVFHQAGAMRAANLEGLVEITRMFAGQPAPAGNRVGIVTSSGSLGVMATDTAVNYGLEVPPLSPGTEALMRKDAPTWMNVKNPLDVGPSSRFPAALAAMMEDPGVDMVIAVTIIPYAVFRELVKMGFDGRGWFGDIAEVRAASPAKPLAVVAVGHPEFISHMAEVAGPDVPVYVSPEPAARALAALCHYWSWRRGEGEWRFPGCY